MQVGLQPHATEEFQTVCLLTQRALPSVYGLLQVVFS
jgi:hypothetical protein